MTKQTRTTKNLRKRIETEGKVMQLFKKRKFRDNWCPLPNELHVKLDSQELVIRSIEGDNYPSFDQGTLHEAMVCPFVCYYDDGNEAGIEIATFCQQGFRSPVSGEWILTNEFDEFKDWEKILVYQCSRLPYENIVEVVEAPDDYGYGPRFFCKYKKDRSPYSSHAYRFEFKNPDRNVLAPLDENLKRDLNGPLLRNEPFGAK